MKLESFNPTGSSINPKPAKKRLQKKGIIIFAGVGARGLRISLHFYNFC
jgi:hypothetical protein